MLIINMESVFTFLLIHIILQKKKKTYKNKTFPYSLQVRGTRILINVAKDLNNLWPREI